MTDLNMHLFIEKGKRGGPAKPSKFITYFDTNNLYVWVISLPLPKGGFKWEESDAHSPADHEA